MQVVLDDASYHLALAGATFNSVSAQSLASASVNLSAGRYNGKWIAHIFNSTGLIQQSQVRKDSWVPSTGTVSVEPGWVAPSALDQFELTGLFPVDNPPFVGDTSYRSLLNAALRKLLVPDRVTIAITTSQSYSLTSIPGLDRPERLLAVLEPGPTGGVPVDAAFRRPRLVRDAQGAVLILDVPFITASGSLTLDILRPADTVIATLAGGSVFADSTSGFVNDFDQAKPDVAEIVEVGLAEAFRALMNRGEDARWRERWQTQEQIARSQPHYDRSLAPATAQTEQAAA